MGAYVTGDEVYDLLINQQLGPPTRIPPEDVEPYIAGVEGQVNGVLLARGYQPVPATNADAVAVIREQVRKKVAVLVFLALNQPTRSPDWAKVWDIDFGEWLNRLRLGQELLPGGTVNPLGDAFMYHYDLGLTEIDDD